MLFGCVMVQCNCLDGEKLKKNNINLIDLFFDVSCLVNEKINRKKFILFF